MARKTEMEFPTEWVIYDADDEKRAYEEKHGEHYANDAAADRKPAATAYVDTAGSEDIDRAGSKVKVMRAAG